VWKLRLGPAPTFEFELAPRVCIDQLLSVAEVVLEDLFELNPRLRLDRRASDLDDEVRELRAWLESTTVGNQYLDAPERFLADFGHLTAQTGPASPPAAGFAWPFAQVRRLHPSHAWTFCAPRIGFRDIAPTRHGLVVPAGERIVCLDWSDGVERWSYEAAGVDRAGCHVSGDCVVVGTGGEESVPRVLDLGRGESLFELRDAGGLGRPACIARYDSESLLVSIGADGVALGSDTAMGVARWRTELGGPRLHDAVASGPVLCALAENGALSAVHPLDGSLLWRVYLEGGEPFALRVHQGRLYAFMLDLERGRIHIYALYPFSGRTVRHWRLEGSPAGGPQFFDDRMIVAVERHGRLWLLGLATEEERSWRRELHSVGFDGPSRARAVRVDGRRCIVVRTDRGELSCISLNDGALAWRVEPVDEHGLMYSRPGLEQVRDCILTVGTSLEFRRVSDGSLVHRFTRLVHTPRFLCAVGELDVVVGESSEGEGGVDRLVDLRFGHFVAEV
jgi:outer membrane protein assembly factor BamB